MTDEILFQHENTVVKNCSSGSASPIPTSKSGLDVLWRVKVPECDCVLAVKIVEMQPAQVKPPISPELLNQIDVRVGTILSVTDVANSDKLIALEVSFGDHKRSVLAGMKRERANPREIEGKQALFVVNLTPRKMAGMVSEGTLFDIGYLDGIAPVLAIPETRVPDGTRAG